MLRNGQGKKGRRREQSALARFAMANTFAYAVLSAISIGFWVAIVVRDYRAVAGVAGLVFFGQLFLWGRTGPARLREERLFGRGDPPAGRGQQGSS